MWITIKDVLVFESVHTPKKQSWTAANRMMQKLGQIGLITVGLGILLGVGAWLTSGAAVFLAGLIIVWAMFAVVGLMASYNDDHRASLARSILAGKRRLYYATPEDFSYQVRVAAVPAGV